ncbi:hypothetical protein F4X73_15020 [Candidatus Poribacteria bacterium]|nr:hypothetical protein [Candidatus Poribacteria bacterium]MYB66000.1 hypothetical protein [Candidatus Poribacteria bacterium]
MILCKENFIMNLSHKLTFSLACFIVLLAFTALPAMAQTISATWVQDYDDDTADDQPGWNVTVAGLTAEDNVDITYLNVNLAAAASAGTQAGFADVGASPATSTTGQIAAALGSQIAVQVAAGASGSEVTYQRVTFPVASHGATLTAKDLVRLPMLADLTTPLYYANFGDMVTVTFNFAAAVAATNGDPVADLHVSDVTLGTPADWQYISVSKSGMTRSITYRSTHAANATSVTSTVNIGTAFATPTDPATDGQATIHYDNTAPTVTDNSVGIAAPPGFGTPPDGIWNSTFILTFSISDDTDGSGLPDSNPVRIRTDTAKLSVDSIGLADADNTVVGTEYLVRITPKADRVTRAGEDVLITIVPIDKAGNEGSSITSVKLTLVEAPPVQPNRAPDFGANTIQNITATAGTAITTVTLPAAVDPDGDSLIYSISPTLPAGLSFNAGTRMLSGTPTAMMAQTAYTYTARDGDGATDTIMFNITVNAARSLDEVATAMSSAVITIQPESFVVIVRDEDAMNNEGIQFRSDVTVVEWPGMPDLERLFYRGTQGIILDNGGGGAIILNESAAQAKDRRVGSVGISEIMWAIDKGYLGDETREKSSQWIELHNLNAAVQDNADTADVDESDDGVAKVYLSWKTGRDITSDSTITSGLSNPVLDVVTNFFNNRPGGPAWDVKGNSGNSIAGEDFASMARILPHNKSAYANADGARYDNRDGRNAGHWNASTSTYLNARTTIADGTDVVYQYEGTPGRANHVSVQNQPHVRQARTAKPSGNTIVINEVGNNSNDAYDWVEIRNASGGEINLKNYLVTKVTDNNTETVIVRFPANDNVKLASNAVFLILASEPADDLDHPIAANGHNVDKPAQEQVPGTPNSKVRYKVSSFNLPNDGNVVLMVRKPDSGHNNGPGAHKDQGTSETASTAHGPDLHHIVDIAGYHPNLRKEMYPNPVSSTNLWPLYAFDRPSFTNNRFDQNTVHQRNRTGALASDRAGVGSANNREDQTAFGNRGWTGVGYRRMAAQTAANGGTPGYSNGAFHDKGDDIRRTVYISEIMYADDERGSLPQWIELRNPSNAMGANLHNWRLTITNHDSKNADGDAFEGRGSSTVLLRGLEIQPNSAVLITSRKGPRSDVRLSDDGIFVLYPTHRNAFSMANATSDILNSYGFKIRLEANAHDTNKKHEWQLVEEVGNLAERRTGTELMRGERTDTERYDAPRWMWPDANTEDDARISVARTNMRGGTMATGFTVSDGKSESGWILSNMDMRTDLISPTYYGHRDDWSTPGQTRGQPLPVELSHFRPTLENGKVTIQWTTESELDNAGFNILRSDTRDGEFTQVNEQMIQGKGTTAERNTYKWVDTTAKPGAVYYYQIEDVSFAGQHNVLATTKLKGLISAKGKLTTQWGDLKNLR